MSCYVILDRVDAKSDCMIEYMYIEAESDKRCCKYEEND